MHAILLADVWGGPASANPCWRVLTTCLGCSEQRAHGDAQAREPFAREGSGVPRGWGRARCVLAHTHFVEVGKYLSPARLASTTQRIVTKFDFVGTRALKAWSVLVPAKMLCP